MARADGFCLLGFAFAMLAVCSCRGTDSAEKRAASPVQPSGMTQALESARPALVGGVVLEVGPAPGASLDSGLWEVRLANGTRQVLARVDSNRGEQVGLEEEQLAPLARELCEAASQQKIVGPESALDAASQAVHSLDPDMRAIALLLTLREGSLRYQVALQCDHGQRVVELSAIDARVLSVERLPDRG